MNKVQNLLRATVMVALFAWFGTSMSRVKEDTMLTQQQNNPPAAGISPELLERAINVRYTNYRGETAVRCIVPLEIYWGKTEYHPHEQWLLRVYDVERGAERIYAFKDIKEII